MADSRESALTASGITMASTTTLIIGGITPKTFSLYTTNMASLRTPKPSLCFQNTNVIFASCTTQAKRLVLVLLLGPSLIFKYAR